MANLFHINKYKYNDEITIEERHYEWYNTTERVINGGLYYPKYRRTYTEIVGVSSKTNVAVTHKHFTYIDVIDELKELGYKIN